MVTALCITRNRRAWLPKAIKCFLGQQFEPKELLIISDGEDVSDLIPADERIRHFHLDGSPQIGDKRNFGCCEARGEIIVHWDDDDYSAPGRLADQVNRLTESGKTVTGYHSMKFIDGPKKWLYCGSGNYVLGTSLCYRRDWWERNRFPAVHVGEDNMFVAVAWAAGQLVSAPAGDLMHATVHEHNTSPRHLTGSNWHAISA